jgi:choline-sulfatase
MKRPHFLFIMADQMAAPPLPFHGGKVVKARTLSRLAAEGVVFERAYCNSPICAPSRFSMLSGRYPTTIGAFDNAAEFPASTPTLMHYLVLGGYRTILAGKMHFIGPDQLHGYEERLVTDIYPADFAWTPDWRAGPSDKPSGISMRNVLEAGTCVRSLQMDYDDEVEHFAIQKLYDLARDEDRRPWFLTVSFSHPHPPYTIGEEHWNRYRDDEIDLPRVPAIPLEKRDIHSRWLHESHGMPEARITDEHVRAARHAYYGMIEYVDDKVGRLLRVLADCGMRDDTIVVFCADHGEMLGERGMWYKQTFFEGSARVPLVFHAPARFAPRRVGSLASLADLLPTICELAGATPAEWADPVDGRSLAALLQGASEEPEREVLCEYTDMGVIAPARMIRKGPYKLIYTHGHPNQLYDLERDPDELTDLSGSPRMKDIEETLLARLLHGWDPDDVHRRVLASQRRRLLVEEAMNRSQPVPDWSYQAASDDKRRFVRASGAAGAKARARFPRVGEAQPLRSGASATPADD